MIPQEISGLILVLGIVGCIICSLIYQCAPSIYRRFRDARKQKPACWMIARDDDQLGRLWYVGQTFQSRIVSNSRFQALVFTDFDHANLVLEKLGENWFAVRGQ